MAKIFWKALLTSPAVFGAALVISGNAIAFQTHEFAPTGIDSPEAVAFPGRFPSATAAESSPIASPLFPRAYGLDMVNTPGLNESVQLSDSLFPNSGYALYPIDASIPTVGSTRSNGRAFIGPLHSLSDDVRAQRRHLILGLSPSGVPVERDLRGRLDLIFSADTSLNRSLALWQLNDSLNVRLADTSASANSSMALSSLDFGRLELRSFYAHPTPGRVSMDTAPWQIGSALNDVSAEGHQFDLYHAPRPSYGNAPWTIESHSSVTVDSFTIMTPTLPLGDVSSGFSTAGFPRENENGVYGAFRTTSPF